MIRRLFAILLSASMSHVAIAGGDLACATHGAHAVAGESRMTMPDMHQHGDAGQTQKERCKTPARSDCCEAATTCATSAALLSVVESEDPPIARVSLVGFVADAPLTRIIPPDPPPPKA